MIPLSAPSISANVAKANGPAPSPAPNGVETAGFAAILGATESPADNAEGVAADTVAALVAVIAGLPDGKSGKAGGKNLPDGEHAVADNLETSEAPDEAGPDQADVPIAAAIPVLPLNVPPLPGIGNPVEFRAAVPDTQAARAVTPQAPTLAAPIARQAVQKQAVARSAVPAQVLNVALDPIVTAETAPQVDAKGSRMPAAGATAQIASMNVATTDTRALEQKAGNLNQAPHILSGDGVNFERNAPGQLPGSRPTDTTNPQASVRDGEPVAAKALSPVNPANKAPSAASPAEPAAAAQTSPAFAAVTANATMKRGNAEPRPEQVAIGAAEPDRLTSDVQPAPNQVSHQSNSQLLAPVRIADAAPASSATETATEQPHDFATLVDRLSQAREAASPQVVRTALQHAEFGRVSLQFRHDDANLSVTLASADPAFNSAVHSAAAASLAGNGAGNSDQSRSDGQQHQQQYQPASQQQSGASGSGSQGQQQSAQARSEQAERMFQRAQGSSPRAEQGETASSGHADGSARRSGIYA